MRLQKLFSPPVLIISVLLVLIISTYRQLPLTFYQQDEWLGLGQILAVGWESVVRGFSPLQLLFADGRPFTRILGVIFFGTFPLESFPLAVYSIFFHFLNTVLVYLIAFRLFKRNIPAFVASSFFALHSVSHQAVSWFGASFGTQPAAFFVLLSVSLYLMFLERKKNKLLYLSLLSALISLYFKEIGLFLFVFLPLITVFYKSKFSFKKDSKIFIPFISFISVFVFYRLFQMVFVKAPSVSATVFVNSSTENFLITLFIRAIMYSLTSFSLIFIPYEPAGLIATEFTKIYYPYVVDNINRWDAVTHTAILDVIGLLLSFILILTLSTIYLRVKENRKVIIFSVLFFILSIAPYIVVEKGYAYLEPRYYYITSVASGIILALYFDSIVKIFKGRVIILAFLILLFLGYLRYNIGIIRGDIAKQVDIANQRQAFLNDLKSYLPTLTSNTNIFYITGNRSFLVDGNKTPFQHGFGYSLMAIYYKSGKIPTELPASDEEFLFSLGEEGLKTGGMLTFGYYNNIEELKDAIADHSINPNNVHSFYYNWDEKKLYDISSSISAVLVEKTQ